ncbi:hypothetical protein DFR67_103156 [Williamsia limnetica]|uniref:Uncharacterized protein n=1 Tax=Williamsia limnetica TaxID=882452 RepID=A0A318RZ70_WILLI|nr:hypothetical protein [Williamsia limnetica]PYE19245.1 hypothetical protein DFR67_103156 [Williamsia limnetica]
MSDDPQNWSTLSGEKVKELERWGSAWADLQHAGMALFERQQLPRRPSSLFQRRALWESAVVAYARADQSKDRRDIQFKNFVQEITGDSGSAMHKRVMDWRHGHVAHRKRAEFESAETVIAFRNGSATPSSLHLVLGIDLGPEDDSEFVAAFRQHVEVLRNAMYETRISPLAKQIIDNINESKIVIPSEMRPADDQSSSARYVINHLLLTLDAVPKTD